MKKIMFLIAASLICFTACKKEKDDVSKVVDISSPDINLNGDKYVTLNPGQNYDDPGAVSVDDVTGAQTTISADAGNLDPNTPGLYYMSYTATNANGYQTVAGRYIAVTDYNDNINLEGTYLREATGIEVQVTKVSRAMYKISDMGGAGLDDAAYIAVLNDSTFDLGVQISESLGVEIDGGHEKIINDGGQIILQYSLDAPGYGTAVRTFVKQP